ncbi:transketolase [Mariniplasma sp. M4Ah]|uniref:Transketolase n=2 Tax=Peloplasma aerotolerans TaxID=3044389 RepID=A0AAW6UAC6_9MOLU|nr:transketolase [Mariniplasma sp. M4Ah]MDI6453665.1 transketolase [Mariniplasma sp. M4Ah]
MEQKAINTIRFLGVDAVNKANSGHPGIVLGAAPMAYTLFTEHLNINVKDTKWINRDRFILSAGHGSMLLYALNHLSGYKISIEDLKNFRQVGNTPGHPEYGHTDGVETTSGPLGQGISNAVGMAIAESHLASRFNREQLSLIDHYTYALCGDGDLQEGVAMESMSLAGHLGLGKLIVLFDSNDIQLDGEVKMAYSEEHKKKFESIGWQYLYVEDGNDLNAINKAINRAKKDLNKPSIIEIKTVIGYGTSASGTSQVHGSPIGEEEAEKLRKTFNWKYKPFEVSEDVYEHFRKKVLLRGQRAYRRWNKLAEEYQEQYPKEYGLFESFINDNIEINLNDYSEIANTPQDATRNISGKMINKLSEKYLNLIGGSADLTVSTKAKGADGHYSKENRLARNINFGVREHAMGAIVNGMVLHGGLKVFGGAFFVFSDYMKPAIRLSAIMQIPSIFVFSHDSIGVGEDGPTHQPVEQLIGLRSIPGLNVLRPADAIETLASWKIAMESKHVPTAIILTRQNVKNQKTTSHEGLAKGAYIVSPENNKAEAILLASGSEVDLAVQVKNELEKLGKDIRVVSMPSHYLFEKQTLKYKKEVLPKSVKTIAIEMGSSFSWYKYTQNVYGIDTFGVSAPLNEALEQYHFTKEKVVEYVLKKLA